MDKVAVVILNWNGRALMEKYLSGVVQLTEAPVVVADNGSEDDSLAWLQEHFPEVRRLSFDKNYGFAEGYNKAIEAVEAEYVVLLNSDVKVTENWLRPMLAYMENHPEVAACQPKILSLHDPSEFEYAGAAGGFIDALGYPFCRGRIQSLVEEDNGQYDSTVDVFWATGACMLIRREDYLSAGGLDADFFAHMEEIDLCWRLNARGKRLVCLPQSVVFHLGGGTLNAGNPRKTFLNFRNNLLMLYKNLPEKDLRPVMRKRAFWDWVAAFFFLLKGEAGNFHAVFKARRAFRRMKPQILERREANQKAAVRSSLPVYPGNSTLDFYLKGRRTFDKLGF